LRIEGLSDLIFGLALSIGALSLLSKPPSTAAEVRSDIVGFGFSFLILIFVWMSYTRVMSLLPLETGTTLLLNILMLFLVAIEPYLFYLVSQFGHVNEYRVIDYASTLYAFDMGGLMAILAFFNHELSVEEKGLVSQALLPRHKRTRNVLFLQAGLFFVTALPQFWLWQLDDTPIRFYLWFGPLAITWVSRSLRGFRD
jgi:uncharacterized membrane protein